MKVLITGSAGFIGFHMVTRLSRIPDIQVFGIDNLNNYYDPNLKLSRLIECGIDVTRLNNNPIASKNLNYIFQKIDLTDLTSLDKLFFNEQFDLVIALGAQAGVRHSLNAPLEFIDSNIYGFLNILECCRKYPVKHLLFASTSSVYGLNRNMPFSEKQSVNHPISLYSATKKSNELMAHCYSHLYAIPTTGLRFFTVYGPWGRPDMALFKFSEAIFKNQPIDVYNNGNMLRDYTYIDDIIETIYRLINIPPVENSKWDSNNPDPSTSSAPYRILNIGNSNPVPLLDYIKALEVAIGRVALKNFLPIQPGDVLDTFADVSEIQSLVGFKPNTSIQEGIAEFVRWYKTYYKIG